MGSIRALILLRNRDWKSLMVDPVKTYFTFRGGLYVLKSEHIRDGPKGPEAIYFEDNPTPLNKAEKDDSSSYLNDEVLNNFLTQVHGDAKGGGLNLFGWVRPFMENPQYMIGGILVLVVVWALFAGGFKI